MNVYKVKNACVDVSYLVLGPLENNIYIAGNESEAFVVDPTENAPFIMQALGGRTLRAIILTHHHADHMGAACELRSLTGASVIASSADAPFVRAPETVRDPMLSIPKACEVDKEVLDGEKISIAGISMSVMLTPGHSKGSMCLYVTPDTNALPCGCPVLFSGDTLFAGATGRTDFGGGSAKDMAASIKRLAKLPDETLVLPGHNNLTSIGAERARTFAYWVR